MSFYKQGVSFMPLFRAGRPVTAGVFGLVLPVVSFTFSPEWSWGLVILTAISFTGLTMSIMVFNDWKDRHHDCKKGKFLASEHPKEFVAYWKKLSLLTSGLLLLVAVQDIYLAAFCVLVWCVGLAYSFIPHWYIIQNLVVALCGGAPALCGAVHSRELKSDSVLTFLLFMTLLFLGEVYKDIEDAWMDAGYKATLPVRLGFVRTVISLMVIGPIPVLLAALHPNPWVLRVMVVGMPILMCAQATLLLRSKNLARTRRIMEGLILILLLTLLVT